MHQIIISRLDLCREAKPQYADLFGLLFSLIRRLDIWILKESLDECRVISFQHRFPELALIDKGIIVEHLQALHCLAKQKLLVNPVSGSGWLDRVVLPQCLLRDLLCSVQIPVIQIC